MSPGSWEINELRRNSVLLASIAPNGMATQVSMAWAQSYRELQLPPGSMPMRTGGLPFGPARNQCVRTMLDHGFSWLAFWDTDVLLTPDAIMRLLATGRDYVGAVYRQRFPPYKIAAFNKQLVPIPDKPGQFAMNKVDVPKFNPGDIIPVDFLPTGATLISRRCIEAVIARYPKPFEWGLDIDGKGSNLSEDYDFCAKAAACGYQAWLNTGVDCNHETSMQVSPTGPQVYNS